MRRATLIALVIALLTALWIGSGLIGLGKEEAQINDNAVAPDRVLQTVRVSDVAAQTMVQSITVNGRSQALRRVTVRVEVNAPVIATPVAEGDRVAAGDVLMRLAEEDRPAALAEARATLAQRELQFRAAQELAGKGFNSEVRLAEARAEMERARAAVVRAELAVENLAIEAPIDGVLAMRSVEVGDFVRTGDAVGEIVDLSAIEVVGFLSETRITHVSLGAPAEIRFLEGESHRGKITYIAPVADPQTRTFRIEVTVPNEEGRLVDGLTARMRIPLEEERAHKVPLSALTLDDAGNVGIKAVNAEDRVVFMPVQIINDTADGVRGGGGGEGRRVSIHAATAWTSTDPTAAPNSGLRQYTIRVYGRPT